MTANPPSSRWSPASLALLAAGIFLAILAAGYAVLSRVDAPDYGAWTGIRPLETKLRMLEEFAAAGDVDALSLGSSITEFGFHAQYFSQLMSERLGRPYRAFNFASGGAEPRTLPKLYRLARSVSRPKTVLVIVPPEPKLLNKIYAGSPDLTLSTAPVATVLDHPWLLDLNRRLWNTRMLKNAPAVRDLALFGHYRSLAQAVGMEAYGVTPHGDRISYLVTWRAADLPTMKASAESGIPLAPRRGAAEPPLEEMLEHHFAQIDIDAIDELRRLVRADGGQLVLISHAGAASLWGGRGTDERYERARLDYLRTFARALEAEWFDAAPLVEVPTYAVSDVTHLNVHGSLAYTRVAAALLAGDPPAVAAERARAAPLEVPPLDYYPGPDKTFNQFSALVRRPPGQAHPLLKFRTIASLAVPKLPNQDGLWVGLRLPDKRDIIARAVPIGPGDFVAEVNLPPAERAQGIVVRVLLGDGEEKLALANPIEDYEWLESFPRTPLRGAQAAAADALALPPRREPGEALYVALKATQPPQRLAVRLQSRAGNAAPVMLPSAPATGSLLKAVLPKQAAPGDYDLQVVDAASGKLVAASLLQVVEPELPPEPAELRLVGTPAVADGAIKVAFKGVRRPHAQDWVGLFPEGGKPDSRLELAFTRGRGEGEATVYLSPQVVAAITNGNYVMRMYAAGGWLLLAQSEPFRFDIAPRMATLPPGAQPVRLSSEPNPAIAAGGVKVAWSRIPRPMPKDWIGLFPADGRPEDRIDLVFTDGKQDGELRFPVRAAMADKLAQGEHEFRLYSHGSWDLLARGERFRFQPLPAALAAAPPGVAAAATPKAPAEAPPARVGTAPPGVANVGLASRASLAEPSMKVRWSGIREPSGDDWIGLFPANGKAEERLDFVFTKAAAQGEMAFPVSSMLTQKLRKGEYELRFYRAWNLLARSERFAFAEK